jgi:hypothetical protein
MSKYLEVKGLGARAATFIARPREPPCTAGACRKAACANRAAGARATRSSIAEERRDGLTRGAREDGTGFVLFLRFSPYFRRQEEVFCFSATTPGGGNPASCVVAVRGPK